MYYYYAPLWRGLFEALGYEVVISDVTNKTLAAPGVKATVAEICLPIKIYNAHVINLLEKGVDKVFVPRLVNAGKGWWFCPKYLGLPNIVSNTIPELGDRMLTCDIISKDEEISDLRSYVGLCKTLKVSGRDMKKALAKGRAQWKKQRDLCRQGYTINEAEDIMYNGKDKKNIPVPSGDVKIGLLGYVYNVYDPFESMQIIDRLRDMGVLVRTFEMIDERELSNLRPKKGKKLFWLFTDKLYEAGKYFLDKEQVDGLIHITAFGCGPDSVLGRKMEFDFSNKGKPLMTLRVDEHTGESHLQTRIEAFVDMIRRRRMREA